MQIITDEEDLTGKDKEDFDKALATALAEGDDPDAIKFQLEGNTSVVIFRKGRRDPGPKTVYNKLT